jgi:hypothetical protein
MRHVRTLIRVMARPRDLFEGGLLGAVPVGASRAPRAGIVRTNDPSADAVRVYDQASNGKLQSAASYATDGVDGSTFGCSGGRPGNTSGGGPARQRLPRGMQQEAERQEMQVAGIRRVGARVEMIEVGEPRRLASDVGEHEHTLGAGGFILVPQGLAHTFATAGPESAASHGPLTRRVRAVLHRGR